MDPVGLQTPYKSLRLGDVRFSDGDEMAHVYISAFWNDPFHQSLFPDMPFEKQVAGVISRWPRNFGDLSALYKKVVDTETGDIVSYSKWTFANTAVGGELRKPDRGILAEAAAPGNDAEWIIWAIHSRSP
jgi:hypothetical protein